MTTDETRAYLQRTHDRAREGSSRRLWAAAMLAQLDGKTKPAAKKQSGR